ncbi:MAG: response regulator [Chloroflexi bacterium]|nr:response regulator [Chloroflexota bacterium]
MEQQFHILIVEDHRELARMLRAGIQSLGDNFVVFDAPSGEEALLEAMHHPIDLAVVDMRLPGMDGPQVIQRLRAQHPQTKIFLLSGLPDDAVLEAAKDLEADAWFRKPVELADLLDAIERHLGLVKSILGDLPPSLEKEEEQATDCMADLLADLRNALDARAVVLLDEVGHVVLQAGSLDSNLVPREVLFPLMTVYATGLKISRLLKSNPPRNHFIFESDEIALHLTPVDRQYALLILCTKPCNMPPLTQVVEQSRKTAKGLFRILERLGVLRQNPPEVAEAEAAPEHEDIAPASETLESGGDGDDLLSLLNQGLSSEEADRFWEALADGYTPGHAINPDVLSYEQAKRLGLAPDEASEEAE